jgi:hypothetical protein
MPLSTSNHRIREVYRELGSIIEDSALSGRLPYALLDKLQDMRGKLLEVLNTSVETDLDNDLLPAELLDDAPPADNVVPKAQ